MREEPKGKIPLHRDPKVRAWTFQIIVVLLLFWGIYIMAANTVANLEERGIILGISWLKEVAPFQIGFSPFLHQKLGETTYWDIFLIGIQNTAFVSFFGVIGATFLGFFIGVARLSPNWLVSKLAAVYIEFFRNIPLLLWFFFWYFVVFLPGLPKLKSSINIAGWDAIFINNSGLYLPRPFITNGGGAAVFLLLCLAAVVGVFFLVRWARRRQAATGQQFPAFLVGLAVLLLVPTVGFLLTGAPYALDYPEAGRFQMDGGMNLTTEFLVCWFSLTTYTAAFIAENVRGGILSVSHGQTEASHSLGLRHNAALRLVVIPQAMRVIIPPTISQYLNLTKNSTLAVAVAYEEINSLWLGITNNVTGQALVIFAMTIGVFWSLSFLTSAILNWYNKRVQLTER